MPKSSPQTSCKQTTLSSFFNSGNSAPKSKSTAVVPVLLLSKRPSNGNIDSISKKRRIISDELNNDATQPEAIQKLAQPNRVADYVFSSSPPASTPAITTTQTQTQTQREFLHQKFVQKLGLDSRKNNIEQDEIHGELDEDGEDNDQAEEEEEEAEVIKKKPTSQGKSKLTPMELQYLEIKRKHLDKIIAYQVGYKYRFLGEDARIAAKELSIVCIPGKFRYDEAGLEPCFNPDRFASASIPIHRLHVHIKRLITAGHKVGVVQQLETPALKAASNGKNKVFKRELTNVYTQSTYVDEAEADTEGYELEASTSGYMICLTEKSIRPNDDERVRIGLVAVQPAIGSILYDEFDDGFMRAELETRLRHISPCEYVLVGDLSATTRKLIKHMGNYGPIKSRIESVDTVSLAEASSLVFNFYAANARADSKMLEKMDTLPDLATTCLSILTKHLREFGLENVFELTKNFECFATRTHMIMNSNTLTSLEIYQSSDSGLEKSSLFWTLNRTKTRFGKRLLRTWVGRPLLHRAHVEARLEAVEELKGNSGLLAALKYQISLARIDLEKSLTRIYYRRASRSEVLTFLEGIQRIAGQQATARSRITKDAVDAIPKALDLVVKFLNQINPQAARDNDKYSFLRGEHESEVVTELRLELATVEYELEQHKETAAKELGRKVGYKTISGIEYLIEVDSTKFALSKVPASWIKINTTKKSTRFHTPTVVRLIRERDQSKEKLANACDTAFINFMKDISENYELLRNCIQALATLDCLCSLAEVALQSNYCKPSFESSSNIDIRQGRHPIVEQMLLESYVPNDIAISSTDSWETALLITGPNMGGKSSYVRSMALIIIMAQIGSYVPAASASLTLVDGVYTRMGANDNLMRGESTFMVELGETADVLRQATSKSLVILDELGRGTSTHDGVAIAEAVLRELVERNVMTLFITHYQELAKVDLPGLRNVHVRFEESGDEITFLYEIGEGVAHRSYGLNVARLANIPNSIIDVAAIKSKELEQNVLRRKAFNLAKLCNQLCHQSSTDSALQQLHIAIEQLA